MSKPTNKPLNLSPIEVYALRVVVGKGIAEGKYNTQSPMLVGVEVLSHIEAKLKKLENNPEREESEEL